MKPLLALVLAGRRGPHDALAGARHRALLDVAGVPMLVRVVRALRASPIVSGIAVSIDEPAAIAGVPGLEDVRCFESLSSPSRSVRDALGRMSGSRVLVTTADHALLTPQIVGTFAESAEALGADLGVGLVGESVIRAVHPDTTRTYLRFRDGGFSGANLFAFRTSAATRAAEFWVRAEQFRKRPWRLASVFGPLALLQFAFRRLTLDAAFERASRAIGCTVAAVPLPFAEAAIDVDRPSDLALVERILRDRDTR